MIETFIEEHTRYKKHCTEDNDTSVPFKGDTLGPHTVLPITVSCPVIFPWISSMVWNLFPFKGDFTFGKSQSLRAPNVGCRGAESPGWFDVSQKNSVWDVIHEQVCCHDEAASHQLPIATAFWIIWIIHRGMFKLNAKFDANSLLYSLSHFQCNGHTVHMLNSVYLPHWLVWWGHHCSCMHIPVHSPRLLGYTDVTQTTLIILTMAGLFPDISHICFKV